MSQLNIFAPKLVITLGEYATRNVLNFKYDKFYSVVGNVYEVNDYKVFIIIFLVVNFMFEILIFIVIKCFAIDAIIKYMKEIVLVVKSFQCY